MSLAQAARSMIDAFEELRETKVVMQRNVFISYTRADRSLAQQLATLLQQHGYVPWWDRRIDAGADFEAEISNALEQAFAVIVIWSPRSVTSQWVKWEARMGLRKGKLIPVAVGKLDLDDIRPPFCDLHTLVLGDDEELMDALAGLGER